MRHLILHTLLAVISAQPHSSHSNTCINATCFHLAPQARLSHCSALQNCASQNSILMATFDSLVSLIQVTGNALLGKIVHTGVSIVHIRASPDHKHFKWNQEDHLWTSTLHSINHTGDKRACVAVHVTTSKRIRPQLVHCHSSLHGYVCEKLSQLRLAATLPMTRLLQQASPFYLTSTENSCPQTTKYPKLRCLLKCFQSRSCLRLSLSPTGTCAMHKDVNKVPERQHSQSEVYIASPVSVASPVSPVSVWCECCRWP